MRNELERWSRKYPKATQNKAGFAGSDVARLVVHGIPKALQGVLPTNSNDYLIVGSAGKGTWTFTPWVAILDPQVTTSAQEGYYIVYLLSRDGSRLYLSLNQGCTQLKNAIGFKGAQDELHRRSALMQTRIKGQRSRLRCGGVSLDSGVWLGKLYEAGDVANIVYETAKLPSEKDLKTDLAEAVLLYETLVSAGGWYPDDLILQEAYSETGQSADLKQAKRYKQHRSIERITSHSKKVKKEQGYRCKGCDQQMDEIYGPIAHHLIEAHHLTPLSSLKEGQVVSFNSVTDFAVLCPNCHSVIHRMDDPSDLQGLREIKSKYGR